MSAQSCQIQEQFSAYCQYCLELLARLPALHLPKLVLLHRCNDGLHPQSSGNPRRFYPGTGPSPYGWPGESHLSPLLTNPYIRNWHPQPIHTGVRSHFTNEEELSQRGHTMPPMPLTLVMGRVSTKEKIRNRLSSHRRWKSSDILGRVSESLLSEESRW